jgi:L-arabinose isomerase
MYDMENKSKIGVLLVTSGWFRDVGLQSDESSFSAEVEKIGKEIVVRLSEFVDPVYPGVLFSEENARQAALEMKKNSIEGLIVSPLMWCEDQITREALKELPALPVILCTFLPYTTLPEYLIYSDMLKGSGSVGTLQLSGFLKREGYSYQAITGYYKDPSVYEIIRDYCNALKVKNQLKNAICGVLPFPCNQMSTTYTDEFNIRKLYGVEYKYLEISRLYKAAQESSPDEIEKFRNLILEKGYKVEINERNLNEGIKYALAMENIIREEDINILCMNDIIDEMHSLTGLRPSLFNPRLSETGLVVSMEADIAAGIGMYILKMFTGQSPFYAEVLTVDLERNSLVLGHAGYHEAMNYDENYPVRIVPDVEYKNTDKFSGAVTCFKYKPGDVTLVNCVYNGNRLRFTACEGDSVDCPPMLEDTNHLFCKLEMPVREFFNDVLNLGISQHFLVIPGKYCNKLERLCRFNDIEYVRLQAE